MLNVKKAMATVCSAALVMSTFVFSAVSVSAAGYTPSLVKSGKKATATANYVRLNVTGLATAAGETDNYTTNGLVQVKVQKDVLKSVTKASLSDAGLYSVNDDEPNWNVALNTSNSAYDVINIGWYTSDACYTGNGDIIDVKLNFKSSVADLGLEILPESVITITNEDGDVQAKNTAYTTDVTKYKLAADGTVTADTEPVDPKPDYVYDEKDPSATNWKAADTDFAPSVYEGTDGSKAVGAKATVNPGSDKNTYTGLVWKVVKKADNQAYTYTQDINITGAADFVYGLVIDGATEDDVDLNSFGVAVK